MIGFKNVPIVHTSRYEDTLKIGCYLSKRPDGSYFASICAEAYDSKDRLLGRNGKLLRPNEFDGISWERLLRCEALRKNKLFRELYILHAFDDCCGIFHDGYDDNGKQIIIKYKLTDDTVNKLLNILNKEY